MPLRHLSRFQFLQHGSVHRDLHPEHGPRTTHVKACKKRENACLGDDLYPAELGDDDEASVGVEQIDADSEEDDVDIQQGDKEAEYDATLDQKECEEKKGKRPRPRSSLSAWPGKAPKLSRNGRRKRTSGAPERLRYTTQYKIAVCNEVKRLTRKGELYEILRTAEKYKISSSKVTYWLGLETKLRKSIQPPNQGAGSKAKTQVCNSTSTPSSRQDSPMQGSSITLAAKGSLYPLP